MLIFSRKSGECFKIGNNVTVTVAASKAIALLSRSTPRRQSALHARKPPAAKSRAKSCR